MKFERLLLTTAILAAPDFGAAAPATAAPTCHGQEATIVGSSASETLDGTPSDDVIVGRGGFDEITGGGGDDLVCSGPRADKVAGGPGRDRIYGSLGGDELGGGDDRDFIFGGDHEDSVTGGEGADVLHGKAEGDTLVGGPGDDRMVGSPGPGRDVVDYSSSPSGITADLHEGTATGDGHDELVSIEGATGSMFNDLIFGTFGPDVLQGGPSLPGSEGHDGDDHIVAHTGDDILRATDGADSIDGQSGDDLLYTPLDPARTSFGVVQFQGGNGEDHLIAARHNAGVTIDLKARTLNSGDWFSHASEIEHLTGTSFDDHLAGTDARNFIRALGHHLEGDVVEGRGRGDDLDAEGVFTAEPTGTDEVYGGDGNDKISAGMGPDVAFGGNGNDFLYGAGTSDGNGPKTFHGEAGEDVLWGSGLDDFLFGGSDLDEFFAFDGEDTCDDQPDEEAQSCELSPPPSR